jgi:hypothetical protein
VHFLRWDLSGHATLDTVALRGVRILEMLAV